MRRYDNGVLVGEIDEPTTTLRQWAETELRRATDGLNVVIEGEYQLRQNCTLSGRISALSEILYEIDRRQPKETPCLEPGT